MYLNITTVLHSGSCCGLFNAVSPKPWRLPFAKDVVVSRIWTFSWTTSLSTQRATQSTTRPCRSSASTITGQSCQSSPKAPAAAAAQEDVLCASSCARSCRLQKHVFQSVSTRPKTSKFDFTGRRLGKMSGHASSIRTRPWCAPRRSFQMALWILCLRFSWLVRVCVSDALATHDDWKGKPGN